MKEALMLLLVLLIGVFTSQSFGYINTHQDSKLLSAIYAKVDMLKATDREKLEDIYGKLPPVMSRFEGRPQESYLLNKIYTYVDRALYPQVATTQGAYSAGLIEALGEMFQ